MNRRTFLTTALAMPIVAAQAADQPWSAGFLPGHFDGKIFWSGLQVKLQPGWKTYWRVPGASGIAPVIEAQGSNLKSFEVLYPTPVRLKSGDGDIIGYSDEVVFPVKFAAVQEAKPLSIRLNAFLGVCDQVCIPVRVEGEVSFDHGSSSGAENMVLEHWIDRLPKPWLGLVTAVTAALDENQMPVLNLVLAQPVIDIFVEGKAGHYFHAPAISGMQASIKVSGAKTVAELKGASLRLTMATTSGGVEETVTVV